MSIASEQGQGGRFPTTSWTLVSLLREAGTDEASKLMGPFLQSYYPALRDFLRLGMMVSCSHERDDLIQGFVADRILAKSIIKTACRDRGKLRSYILACLANYVRDHMKSKPRREWSALESINDETVDCLAPNSDHTVLFEMLWAREVTNKALQLLKAECLEEGRGLIWTIFELRVLESTDGVPGPPTHREIADKFNITPVQAKNLLVTAKRAYLRHLTSVVGEYTVDDKETETEIRCLRQSLTAGATLLDNSST